MKILIAMILAITTSLTFACTDFSGEYYDEMDGTYFSMTQNACESITYNYDEGPVERLIDGQDYLVNEYDIVIEEGKILANVKIFSSNQFLGAKLIRNDRSEITYTSGGVDIEKVWSETALNKSRDMITISHAADGSNETTINKRVK